MASKLNKVLEHLHQVLASDCALTDGQLLARFVASRDEASFQHNHLPRTWPIRSSCCIG
jgi:hypothetical protein